MRLGETGRMNAAINVTPLVDVVLVLLIVFMVMAPQMRTGPEVDLPETAKPRDQGDERGRILVTPEKFGESLRAAVGDQPDPRVVVRSDARLRFGDVRRAMVAIEVAGFSGVGLIADSAGATTGGE